MKKSITQEFNYGCGIACFAFVTGTTYKEAEDFLGRKQVKSPRFWCKDFTSELNRYGMKYIYKYVKPKIRKRIYQENAIVLVARSKRYPVGHYLVRYNNRWMDPWINLPKDNNIKNAKSGFRKRLPSRPMYIFLPQNPI
jgi:hypothetical protein